MTWVLIILGLLSYAFVGALFLYAPSVVLAGTLGVSAFAIGTVCLAFAAMLFKLTQIRDAIRSLNVVMPDDRRGPDFG